MKEFLKAIYEKGRVIIKEKTTYSNHIFTVDVKRIEEDDDSFDILSENGSFYFKKKDACVLEDGLIFATENSQTYLQV